MPLSPSDIDGILDPQPIVLEEAEPVFIVGSVRSGTSITVKALHIGAGIPGFYEGNTTSLFQLLSQEIATHWKRLGPKFTNQPENNLISNVDPEKLVTHNLNFLAAVFAKHMGSGRWLDKSPESNPTAPAIRLCPHLARMFPRARFIFCVRRGIENILSRKKKFPRVPFESCCKSWAGSVMAWTQVRDQLGKRALTVFQHEIALQPDKVAKDIQKLLRLRRMLTATRNRGIPAVRKRGGDGGGEGPRPGRGQPWEGRRRRLRQEAAQGRTGAQDKERPPTRHLS